MYEYDPARSIANARTSVAVASISTSKSTELERAHVLLVEAEHERVHVRAVGELAEHAHVLAHLLRLVAARLACARVEAF